MRKQSVSSADAPVKETEYRLSTYSFSNGPVEPQYKIDVRQLPLFVSMRHEETSAEPVSIVPALLKLNTERISKSRVESPQSPISDTSSIAESEEEQEEDSDEEYVNVEQVPAAKTKNRAPTKQKNIQKVKASTSKSTSQFRIQTLTTTTSNDTSKTKKVKQTSPASLDDENKSKTSTPRVTANVARDIQMPITISTVTTILDLGVIEYNRKEFHTERYIYPIGFKSQRQYASYINPPERTTYTCEILDGGEKGPLFKVLALDDPDTEYISTTSTACWITILKKVNDIGKKRATVSVSGPEYFGLSNPKVRQLIETLPNADLCENYVKMTETKRKPKAKVVREEDIIDDDDDDEGAPRKRRTKKSKDDSEPKKGTKRKATDEELDSPRKKQKQDKEEPSDEEESEEEDDPLSLLTSVATSLTSAIKDFDTVQV
jgi:hypothetical protein